MVVVDEAAEHRAGNDTAFAWICIGGLGRQMLQRLMGPAFVVVAHVFAQHPAQMGFLEDDDSVCRPACWRDPPGGEIGVET